MNLGLFAPLQASSVRASYALVGDRGLAPELEDESTRIRRASDSLGETSSPKTGWPWTSLRDEQNPTPLLLVDDSHSRVLPIRIVRHARTIAQDMLLSAQVSRRWVDVLERVNFAVRHGVVNTLVVRVPAGIADRWELVEKELADREDLGRDPDGGRRYRLSFSRPVADKATLRFRYRLPLLPELDAKSVREITIPEISFEDLSPGPTKVEMSLTPEIVLKETDKAWIRTSDDARAEPSSLESAVMSFEEGVPSSRVPNLRKVPFTFKVMALESVSLPPLVVPHSCSRRFPAATVRSETTHSTGSSHMGPIFRLHCLKVLVGLAQGRRPPGRTSRLRPGARSYRLRFPGEFGSRPALVELEYELNEHAIGSKWAGSVA